MFSLRRRHFDYPGSTERNYMNCVSYANGLGQIIGWTALVQNFQCRYSPVWERLAECTCL